MLLQRRKKAKPIPEPPKEPRLIGYARVSTAEQSLDLQIEALKRGGVLPENIHSEHVSGVARKRPKLELALMDCRPGDVLVVWKLDRFARSLRDLLNRLHDLETAGIGFRSLTDSIDTATSSGRLLLGVLGAIAQFERDLISDRTKAGVRLYKERGGIMGKPAILTAERLQEVEKRIRKGETVRDIADSYKITPGAIYAYFSGEMISTLREEGPSKRK